MASELINSIAQDLVQFLAENGVDRTLALPALMMAAAALSPTLQELELAYRLLDEISDALSNPEPEPYYDEDDEDDDRE